MKHGCFREQGTEILCLQIVLGAAEVPSSLLRHTIEGLETHEVTHN